MPLPPTPRLGLIAPSGAVDDLRDGDNTIAAMASRLDEVLAPVLHGTLANRPVSTPGSPGIADRRYRVTSGPEAGTEYVDTGTGWIAVGAVLPTLTVAGSRVAAPAITETHGTTQNPVYNSPTPTTIHEMVIVFTVAYARPVLILFAGTFDFGDGGGYSDFIVQVDSVNTERSHQVNGTGAVLPVGFHDTVALSAGSHSASVAIATANTVTALQDRRKLTVIQL